MSRTPSPLTLAIRQLLDETGGTITHKEARPRLMSLGLHLCDENDVKAFKAERNAFDVTKYNWGKVRQSSKTSPSRKPQHPARTKKSKTLPDINPQESEALAHVVKLGGVAKARKELAFLKERIASIEKSLELVAALDQRLAAIRQQIQSAA